MTSFRNNNFTEKKQRAFTHNLSELLFFAFWHFTSSFNYLRPSHKHYRRRWFHQRPNLCFQTSKKWILKNYEIFTTNYDSSRFGCKCVKELVEQKLLLIEREVVDYSTIVEFKISFGFWMKKPLNPQVDFEGLKFHQTHEAILSELPTAGSC